MAEAVKDKNKLPANNTVTEKHIEKLQQHLFNRDLRTLTSYLSWHFISEILALLNIIIIALWCNWMYNFELYPYGIRFYHFMVGDDDDNPMLYHFPKSTSCTRVVSGGGGTKSLSVVTCILSYNELYGKVSFTFLPSAHVKCLFSFRFSFFCGHGLCCCQWHQYSASHLTSLAAWSAPWIAYHT